MNISLFEILDGIGIFAFAMSGATLAIKKRFDIFGVFVLAFVTATGGGTIRDMLLGLSPVLWIRTNDLIYTVAAGAIAAILFYKVMHRLNLFIYIFDAAGLGLFTLSGIEKGLLMDLNMVMCVALGTISATFGGVIRDVLSGEKPMLLTRQEIYASASVAGGFLYFALKFTGASSAFIAPVCLIFIVLLRMITHYYDIRMPSLYPRYTAEKEG